MIVREASLADIPQMQVIRNSVKENALSNPDIISGKDYMEFISERGKGWVCQTEKQVVGFAILDVREANIWALFVHPDFEKRGIGRKLHDQMLQWYFSNYTQTLWLGTAPDTRAQIFYRLSGWREVGLHGKGEVKFELSCSDWANKIRAHL